MPVIIGVDPHKASHTAVAISTSEDELARKEVRATRSQVEQLLAWVEPFTARLWAIEGADGMDYLLAQQLVATGEHVLNVPATLAARTCLLGSGRSSKNDPNDALSVAVTALRTRDLRPLQPVGHSEVLRLLAKRYGVGPILAAMLIGFTGDSVRVHRLSQRGNRQLNHAIHMVAICHSVSEAPRVGPTSTDASQRARRTRKRCAPSSDR